MGRKNQERQDRTTEENKNILRLQYQPVALNYNLFNETGLGHLSEELASVLELTGLGQGLRFLFLILLSSLLSPLLSLLFPPPPSLTIKVLSLHSSPLCLSPALQVVIGWLSSSVVTCVLQVW